MITYSGILGVGYRYICSCNMSIMVSCDGFAIQSDANVEFMLIWYFLPFSSSLMQTQFSLNSNLIPTIPPFTYKSHFACPPESHISSPQIDINYLQQTNEKSSARSISPSSIIPPLTSSIFLSIFPPSNSPILNISSSCFFFFFQFFNLNPSCPHLSSYYQLISNKINPPP